MRHFKLGCLDALLVGLIDYTISLDRRFNGPLYLTAFLLVYAKVVSVLF
jgi:hypothetical protein